MGGFGVSRELKMLARRRATIGEPKIIVLLEREADAWIANWSRCDAWLVKPVDPAEVDRLIVRRPARPAGSEPRLDDAADVVPEPADGDHDQHREQAAPSNPICCWMTYADERSPTTNAMIALDVDLAGGSNSKRSKGSTARTEASLPVRITRVVGRRSRRASRRCGASRGRP